MAKCRFFPECARCNEVGDSWFPCSGGSDGIRCKGYEPMPDLNALLELADELETGFRIEGSTGPAHQVVHFVNIEMHKYARRIREACGEACDD